MRLHEQRDFLFRTLSEAVLDVGTFRAYLASSKFQGENDYIRTQEMTNFLAKLQHRLHVEV
jgi:hypothetical protein